MTQEVTVKKLRYTGPDQPPITIGNANGTVVTDEDGVVEVDDALAKTLAAQDIWVADSTKNAAPAAKKED